MDTDSATNNATQTNIANLEPLAKSVITRITWGQRAISPWVQRRLAPNVDANPGFKGSGHARTALTVSHTTALLNRLQRTADESAVWHPDVGSVNPQMVSRFTETIAQRYAGSPFKHKTRPDEIELADTPNLTLAGMPASESESTTATPQAEPNLPFSLDEVRKALTETAGPSDRPPSPPQTLPAPVQRKAADQPSAKKALNFPFSVDEVRAALEKPHFTQTPPAQTRSTPNVQRTSQPGSQKPRLFSKVEEVPSSSVKGPVPPSMPPLPAPGESGQSPVSKSPPARPPVQRQIDKSTPPQQQIPVTPETPVSQTPVSQTPVSPPSVKSSAAKVESTEAETSEETESLPVPAEPIVQRQPDTEMPLRQPNTAETQSVPASAPSQPDPAVSKTDSPTPAKSPVQRQPARKPDTPPTDEVEPAQSPAQPALEPGIPTPEPPAPAAPPVQRQPDTSKTEPSHPKTATPKADGPTPAKPTMQPQPDTTLPLRRPDTRPSDKTETAQTPAEPLTDTPAPEIPASPEPAIQRQPDTEIPLRQPDIPAPTETKTASPETQADTPVPESPAPAEPAVQRRPDTEMPLRQPDTPITTKTEPILDEFESDTPTSDSVSPTEPTVQRQPDIAMPLRQPDVPSADKTQPQPKEVVDTSAPEPPTQFEPAIQRQSDSAVETPVIFPEDDTAATTKAQDEIAEAKQQGEPVVQKQPDVDMPLRLPAPGPDQKRQHPQAEDDDVDLGKEIQAKADSGSRLPLTQLPSIPSGNLTRSDSVVQMTVLPQARNQAGNGKEATTGKTKPDTLPLSGPSSPATSGDVPSKKTPDISMLPLAPPIRLEPVRPTNGVTPSQPSQPPINIQRRPEVVQRQPAAGEVFTGFIQRAEEESIDTGSEPGSSGQEALNLDQIARDLLPYIRRLLAVERERRPFR